jgi:hypothetical protein
MSRAIASKILEMHRPGQPSGPCVGDEVTGLVGSLMDTKAPAAILEHLGHERQPFQSSILIQCGKDFGLASYFDDITRQQAFAILTHRKTLTHGKLP